MLFAFEHSTDQGLVSVKFAKIIIQSNKWIQIQLYGCTSENLRRATILPLYTNKVLPNSSFISKYRKQQMKPVILIVNKEKINEKIIVHHVPLIENQWIDWENMNKTDAKKLSKCKGMKYVQKISSIERWTMDEENVLLSIGEHPPSSTDLKNSRLTLTTCA